MKQWFSTFSAVLVAGLVLLGLVSFNAQMEQNEKARAESRKMWEKTSWGIIGTVDQILSLGDLQADATLLQSAKNTLMILDGVIQTAPAGRSDRLKELNEAREKLAKALGQPATKS